MMSMLVMSLFLDRHRWPHRSINESN